MSPDLISVGLRTLGFVAVLQAAGAALYVAVLGAADGESLRAVRRLVWWAATLGAALVVTQQLLEAARMAGDWSGVLDASLQQVAWSSRGAAAVALRLAGLLVVAVGVCGGSRGRRCSGILGVVLVAVSFAVTGHVAVHRQAWALAPLLIVHILIVAFWFGALVPLYMAAGRQPLPVAAQLIARFSALAIIAVPGILLAGVAMTAILVRHLAVFTQPYGELLLTKLGGFTLLMGLAALNKLRFGPGIAVGDLACARGFRRTVAAEYLLIVAVVAATAVMTEFYSPEP